MKKNKPARSWLAAAIAACILAALPSVQAHDSWLAPAAEQSRGLLRLELGVGPRYPLRESGPAASSVARGGCRSAEQAKEQALVPRRENPDFLELRARIEATAGVACWVELKPFPVEMTPELVKTYFSEIRPPAALVEQWSRQQARGVAWRETYTKSLRMELPGEPGAAGSLAALRTPQGLPMEMVPTGADPIRVGQPADFQVLLDGKPLAGQWIELVSSRHTLGIWRQSDAEGKIRQALPFAGRWLLRSVHLEAPADDSQPWRSRFVTLLVHVR